MTTRGHAAPEGGPNATSGARSATGDLSRSGTPAALIRVVAAYALRRGVAPEQISAATGLSHGEWRSRFGRRPDVAMPAIFNLLRAHEPDLPHSLVLGAEVPVAALGPLPYTAALAPTLRTALRTFARFRFLLSDQLHAELVDLGETTHFEIVHPADVIDQGAASEMALLIAIRVIRAVMGAEDAVAEVHFAHQTRHSNLDGVAQHYADAMGVPVRFGQARTGLIFHTASLDVPLQFHGGAVFAAAEERLVDALTRIDPHWRSAPLREAVAATARDGEFTPRAVARRLGMSLRAVQRQAAAEGHTLRTLIDDERLSRAKELLHDDTLTLDVVAELLGYSGPRAFRRAFQRLTGMPPSAFRDAARR